MRNLWILVLLTVSTACQENGDAPPVLSFDQYIFGGQLATLGQFPYQAVFIKPEVGYEKISDPDEFPLRWKQYPILSPYCGGTFIHPQIVLTAAHCLTPMYKEWYIYGNVIQLLNLTDDVVIGIPEKIVFHSNYSGKYNDIGLIKLKEPITNPAIVMAHIAEQDPNPSINYYQAGFGQYDLMTGGHYWTNLSFTQMQIVGTADECGDPPHTSSIKLFCAKGVPTISGACRGDSGGGLVDLTDPSWPVVHGVVSRGTTLDCSEDQERDRTFYTKVSSYKHWITTTQTKLLNGEL